MLTRARARAVCHSSIATDRGKSEIQGIRARLPKMRLHPCPDVRSKARRWALRAGEARDLHVIDVDFLGEALHGPRPARPVRERPVVHERLEGRLVDRE